MFLNEEEDIIKIETLSSGWFLWCASAQLVQIETDACFPFLLSSPHAEMFSLICSLHRLSIEHIAFTKSPKSMSEPFSSKYQHSFQKQLSMSAYCKILTVLFSDKKLQKQIAKKTCSLLYILNHKLIRFLLIC